MTASRHTDNEAAEVIERCLLIVKSFHDEDVERNREVFEDDPPRDFGAYAYTYYDGLGNVIYHGMTTDAAKRAQKHQAKAPWASWVQEVRYRPCSSAHSARLLERRLQNKISSLCHHVITWTHHGEDWPETGQPANHVTGTCKLPGGICNPERIAERAKTLIAESAA